MKTVLGGVMLVLMLPASAAFADVHTCRADSVSRAAACGAAKRDAGMLCFNGIPYA